MAVDPPLRALVVDDDPTYRVLLQAVLGKRRLQADFAEDADTGLRLFEEHSHDILVLDKNLPKVSGLVLARRVRALPAGKAAQILLITGAAGVEVVEDALDSGVDDYLQKPIEPDALSIRLAIAERRVKEAREEARRESLETRGALVDPLTGLATRVILRDRIQGGLHRIQREVAYGFGLLLLDLDAFHRVNETLGEEVGNLVLAETAQRIQDSIRSVDSAARITADEFALFLDDLQDGSDVTRVTNRLKERFSEPMRVEGQNLFVGASMGVALGGPQYSDPEEVFRDASKALRRAKEEGPGGMRIHDPEVQQEASARVEMEDRIREGLEEEEMVLYYQPILSLTQAEIFGVEALIRWPKAEGEVVPLAEFLPVAERSNLISKMGWWTLERACRQMKDWHQRFPTDSPPAVMVNIPGRQFSEAGLVPSVQKILDETGLEADFLHLEISESSAMADVDRSAVTLQALKDLGVHLHLDDFGTGFSSLSHIHRFPIDSLKVDRSFLAGLSERPENSAIVRTIVDLARSLGLPVAVVGIETESQFEFVQELGCDFGQGWLFARAMAPPAVETLLQTPDSILKPLRRAGEDRSRS